LDHAPNSETLFRGGGNMGAMMRAHDWSNSPLGPEAQWPQSLRTSISIVLDSKFPMYIAWGRDYTQFYNDGYRPILGSSKHPQALGISTRETFAEIWDIIGPMFDGVMEGTATGFEDFLLPLDRHGFVEECYFTFSYSPIREEGGGVGGVLVTVTETTKRVLGERRLKTLRALASATADAATPEEACRAAMAALAGNGADLPFAALYLFDEKKPEARLMGISDGDAPVCAQPFPESERLGTPWPLERAAASGAMECPLAIVSQKPANGAEDLPGRTSGPKNALLLPIAKPGQDRPAGILVVGLSPRLPLDGDYRSFLDLVAGQTATAVSSARVIQETRERAAALAELDKAKTAFFSNVSHEFRTPLTLMLGPIEDMLSNSADALSPENRERAAILQRNSVRLLKLVNTLLDFSRIEAGRMDAVFEPVDLGGFTRDIASVFRSLVEKAGLYLRVEAPPSIEPAFIAPDLWEKIVLNLVSNAYKFTFSGGIDVTLAESPGAFELCVRDTGTGIPEAELDQVFARFHRVRSARGRTYEGSGIGLALVQELVKLHGGAIRLESEMGKGSAFFITLPKGSAHLAADRLASPQAREPGAGGAMAYVAYVEEAGRWSMDAGTAHEPPEALDAAPRIPGIPAPLEVLAGMPGSAERARILVVEDNVDMRDYVRRLLEKHWDVDVAQDGPAALSKVRARLPDLILSDVMMPGMDGFALLRELRRDPETRFTPVILLSARAGEESTTEGLEAGADDYLIKPFSARELLTRVSGQIKTAQARKQAEASVRAVYKQVVAERAHLHALFMEAPASICILRGPLHVFEFANPNYLQMVGRKDIIGKSIREVFPELEGQGIYGILDDVYRGIPFNVAEHFLRIDRGQGEEDLFFTFTYQPSHGPDGRIEGVLVFAYDVTTQVQARRRSEDAAKRMADQKKVLEIMAKGGPLDGTLASLAKVCEEHLKGGYASVLLMDAHAGVLRLGAAPSLPASFLKAIEGVPVSPTGGSCGAAAFSGKEIITPDLTADPHWADYQEAALEHGLRACWSWPIISSLGKVLGTFAVYLKDVRRPDAEEQRYMDILRRNAGFVIERHLAEETLRQTEAQLQHSQKMDAVGKLAGGIAHEFNNLLTAINGYTELLATMPEDGENRALYISEVRNAGERATVLTRQLLAFGRKQMLAPKSIDVNDVVEGIKRMLRQVIGENIDLEFRPEASSCRIKADPGQLEQVILNLAINARDAMPGGGKLTLRTERLRFPGGHAAPEGHYVMLEVSDNGIGMDAQTQTRIFEPFFTTKEEGKGTGLGLSMVDGIIRQSGGFIQVESEPGEGASFRIYMPYLKDIGEPDSRPGSFPAPILKKEKGTLLVVEDESAVRKLIFHALSSRGYRVLEASSGEEALDKLEGEPDIALLLTDVVMPGMNGRDLAERVQVLRPGIKVAFMSGYTKDHILGDDLKNGSIFIAKPFAPIALANTIGEFLSPEPVGSKAGTARG
jgi:signal transduction histidine kinase/CheY-like chemotaxis protein